MRSGVTAIVLVSMLQAACSGGGSAPPAASSGAPAAGPTATTSTVTGVAARGALVTLEPVSGSIAPPEGGALMDQFSKQFVPETLFVRVGQEVTFRNSEDQLHNVTVVTSRTGTTIFNISQSQGDTHKHTFDRPGEFDVSCDVHPGMRAMIVATTTPFAMFADERGSFSFDKVTPGAYKLRISSDGRQTEKTIDVAGARVDVGRM